MGTARFPGMTIDSRVIAILLCMATLLPVAAHAEAATYHAYLCRVPYGPEAGSPASTDNVDFNDAGTDRPAPQAAVRLRAGTSCGGGGAISVALEGANVYSAGQGASATYSPPDGLRIDAFRIWRREAAGGGSDRPLIGMAAADGTLFTNLSYPGNPSLQGLCANCSRGGAAPLDAANIIDSPPLRGVAHVRWEASCGGAPGSTCATGGTAALFAAYDVYAADMLLDDAVAPAVSDVGGPLLAGGRLAGAQSVSFRATDAGSGVHRGALLVDGVVRTDAVLDANGGACADLGVSGDGRASFAHSQPCPTSLAGLLTLDTDALASGEHTLTVRVTDAAGNATVAATRTIGVVGARPVGSPNGSGATRAAKLSARHSTTRKSARRMGFRTRPTIVGRLTGASNDPIADATVDVLVRERRVGGRSKRIATVTTGNDGAFRLRLPGGPSRVISVQYKAFVGDATPAETVKLSTLVRAAMTATITPLATRLGRLMTFAGRLQHLRRGRIEVKIQGLDRGAWRPAGEATTRADGRFRWRYRFRFRSSVGRTYRFRAKVSSPIYPFEPGYSRAVVVRVVG